MALRMQSAHSLEDKLFALMMLGDDRCVQATHVMGQRRFQRGRE
jgi:guanine deaminase